MYITAEISCYPLKDAYGDAVNAFIDRVRARPGIEVSVGVMSSLLSGSYEDVMDALSDEMGALMQDNPAVFALKISNACGVHR